MGRGFASKGKRDPMDGPDWLKPPEEVGGGIGIAQPAPEKPKKKKRKGGDDDDLDAPEPTGIQWKPLAFLVLMVLPGLAPVVIGVLDYVNANGYQIPGQALFSPNPYKPCLQEFYADYAPEKLGSVDDTLFKYTGREKGLFAQLSKKYKQKANFAKCVPAKDDKLKADKPKAEKAKGKASKS